MDEQLEDVIIDHVVLCQ